MATNPKKLKIYKISYDLALDFHKMIDKIPKEEAYHLIDQIKRASLSIPLNIAEGCSRQTKKSFMQYLQYAYGSGKELDVLLGFTKDRNYINAEEYKEMFEKLENLMKKLWRFMKFVDKEEFFKYFK